MKKNKTQIFLAVFGHSPSANEFGGGGGNNYKRDRLPLANHDIDL